MHCPSSLVTSLLLQYSSVPMVLALPSAPEYAERSPANIHCIHAANKPTSSASDRIRLHSDTLCDLRRFCAM